MPDPAEPLLFLAVPGTQETRQLDLESVREAVARGEIGLDNWAWSPDRNEWVPLAQLPEFAEPSEPPAPVVPEPVQVAPVVPKPVVMAAEPVKAQAPVVRAGPKMKATTYHSRSDDRPKEFPVLQFVFTVLSAIIVALVVINYFLIEKPFAARMAKTSFVGVSTHAHLGAFMQPNALLVHILPSRKITADNFADLLTAVTQSAPRNAVPGMNFTTVSLTPGWMAAYSINADDWQGFAEMGSFTPEEKRQFVLTHLERAGGAPLLVVHRNETEDQRKADEDKVWQRLVATFHEN